jgi:hypothetical protein
MATSNSTERLQDEHHQRHRQQRNGQPLELARKKGPPTDHERRGKRVDEAGHEGEQRHSDLGQGEVELVDPAKRPPADIVDLNDAVAHDQQQAAEAADGVDPVTRHRNRRSRDGTTITIQCALMENCPDPP